MTETNNHSSPNYMQLYSLTPPFKGNDDIRQAELWLKKVIKYKLHYNNNFNDELFINGITHNFSGTAEIWWNYIEEKVTTWERFIIEFKAKFMKVNADEAWDKLRNSKQSNTQGIENFSSELSILFNTAGITDEGFKISCLISGINEVVAYELEKKRSDLLSFEMTVKEAVEIEKLIKKYGRVMGVEKKVAFNLNDIVNNSENNKNKINNGEGSNNSLANDNQSLLSQDSLAELVQGMKQLNINLVQQQQQIQQLQQQGSTSNRSNTSYVYQTRNNVPFNSNSYGERKPAFVCWNCGKEGHAVRYCPEPYKNNNTSTGNNNQNTENGNNDEGKGKGRQ